MAAVTAHKPDVAIVDVRMPPDHTDEGLRAAIEIRRDHPGTAILVFSQYVETRYAADLLSTRRGGVGYLLKDRVANVGPPPSDSDHRRVLAVLTYPGS